MKIRNVSLVRPDDEDYRAHQGRYAQASMHLRDTLDPGPVQKLSGPIEKLLREWLSRRINLTPRRILRYERLTRENRYKTYYKEIDAVEAAPYEGTSSGASSSSPLRPRRLFEIKCSSNASGALSSADSQLSRATDALSSRWDRQIYRHAVLVAIVPELMDLEEAPTPLEAFAPSLPEGARDGGRLTTCLAAEDLWRWGQSKGLLSSDALEADPKLLDEAQARARQTASRRRRREELKEEGVPREEWPEELIHEASETPETQTATYGDEPAEEESPMARAMREAMESSSE